MPRIRYRRSYDFELYEQSDETTSEESEYESRENASGNSWLSNATIASQLSDTKIKAAISALKAQITVLEAELLSRHLVSGNKTGKNWDEIGRLRGPEDGERLYPRLRSRNTGRKCKTFKKVASLRKTLAKLGVKDVDALLQEWSKITAEAK